MSRIKDNQSQDPAIETTENLAAETDGVAGQPPHVLITKETCLCRDEWTDEQCPACDGGLAICSVCGKAEGKLSGPCIAAVGVKSLRRSKAEVEAALSKMASAVPERRVMDMVWANESNVSVYIYEASNGKRIIEIHGVNNGGYEEVIAVATIERHNRDRFAELIGTKDQRFSQEEVRRLLAAATSGSGAMWCPLCEWVGTEYRTAGMSGPVCPQCDRKGVLQYVANPDTQDTRRRRERQARSGDSGYC